MISDRYVHRELVVLTALAAVTVVTFVLTQRVAAGNEAMRRRDAADWFARGEAARERGDLDAALTGLRQAVVKNAEEPKYRHALAGALVAAGQYDEARRALLALRDVQPEDVETNLQLARLEARQGDRAAAVRYYQTAIAALWTPDQRANRRRIRTEFVEFLLDRGERDRALSELLALEGALPDDPAAQLAGAQLLLRAGDPVRAARHFANVLSKEPSNQPALAGAARASFESADYRSARRYLLRVTAQTDDTRALRALTDLVLTSDPLAPRLAMTERRARLEAGLARVVARLEACKDVAPAARVDAHVDIDRPLDAARAYITTVTPAKATAAAADAIDAGFDLVYRGELAAESACGSPLPLDRALVLAARRHGLDQ